MPTYNRNPCRNCTSTWESSCCSIPTNTSRFTFTANIKAGRPAELIVRDGRVVDIIYSAVRGRQPLEGGSLRDFQTLVAYHADDIVQKWIDYFVLHRSVQPQVITRRIK